jgi:hypothetical protein
MLDCQNNNMMQSPDVFRFPVSHAIYVSTEKHTKINVGIENDSCCLNHHQATPRMPKLRTPLSTPLKFPSATWL